MTLVANIIGGLTLRTAGPSHIMLAGRDEELPRAKKSTIRWYGEIVDATFIPRDANAPDDRRACVSGAVQQMLVENSACKRHCPGCKRRLGHALATNDPDRIDGRRAKGREINTQQFQFVNCCGVQEFAADLVVGTRCALEQDDILARTRQPDGGGGSRRTTSDDCYVRFAPNGF